MPNIHLTYFLPDTIKNNRADTIKKNINKGETVLPKPEQKTDTRKIYDLSVIALIFNSLTTSFYLFNLIKFFFFHSGLTVMLGISLILPLIGVILAYLSQNKIKKENTKYKGLKISKAAIYIGLIPYGIVSLYYFIISIIEIVMAIWWIFYG